MPTGIGVPIGIQLTQFVSQNVLITNFCKDMKNIPLLGFHHYENPQINHFFRIMKVTTFFLFFFVFCLMAENSNSQSARVNISKNDVALEAVLNEIESQTNYLFIYNNNVNVARKVSVKSKGKPVSEILDNLLKNTDINYSMEGTHIILSNSEKTKSIAVAQQNNKINISGKITDEKGESIIGANIKVKGTTDGTVSDFEGNFNLKITNPRSILQVTFIGYNTAEIALNGKTHVSVKLAEDRKILDEVVVVGYGSQKKVTLTGAVSAIKSDELLTTKNENAQNMLTGKVSGVRVVQKSSEPGAFNNSFDIRGLGNPLIIIDGVPRDNITRLDPNDIESLSVLKDASAAIYGVRAANGVVLITTKKGKAGTVDLDYNGSVGWQTPSGSPKSVSAAEWMILANEKKMHNVNGGTLRYSLAEIEEYASGKKQSTDWYDAVMRKNAPQTQHNISATGGNDKTQYYVSAGYEYQESFLRSNSLNYERYNVRSNVTSKISDRLKVELQISGIMDEKNQPYESADWIIRSFQRAAPIQPIYANNNPAYIQEGTVDGSNPVAMMDADICGYKKYNNKWFQSSFSAEYDVPYLTGLKAKAMLSYDYRNSDNKSYMKEYQLYKYDEAADKYNAVTHQSPSKVRREFYSKDMVLYQLSLNYNHTFNSSHNVNALVLLEGQKRNGDNFYAQRELALGLDQLFAGNSKNQEGNMSTGSGDLYKEANMGLVGRLGYDFKSKYLAEFSFRYDGSSKFAKGHQWGFFPSVSGGWRISEEGFWKDSKLNFINNMKVRASYGRMGDDSASSYQFVTGYTYPAGGSNNELPGGSVFDGTFVNSSVNKGIANQKITWFVAKTFDVGFDMEAWNGLLGVSADYFTRDRSGLLTTRAMSLPVVVGASLPQENLNGDFTNGLELELNHRYHIGDFKYNAKGIFSVTRTQNKYQEMSAKGNSYDNWRNNSNDRYQNIWWGYGSNGIYQSYQDIANSSVYASRSTLPGDYIYEDWNGDGIISDLDRHPISFSGTPIVNFGLTLGAEWKGFDLNLLFQGSTMNYVSYVEQLIEPMWGSDYSNALAMFLDRWHPVDSSADPYDPNTQWVSGDLAYTGSIPESDSKFRIHNASYVRLKSAELGYTLPSALTKKVGIKSVRMFVNGYNLFTLSSMKYIDPEHPSDSYGNLYPLNRTISLGLNVKF